MESMVVDYLGRRPGSSDDHVAHLQWSVKDSDALGDRGVFCKDQSNVRNH